MSLYSSCFVMCFVVLYGPSCHGAHKLVHIAYNNFSLNISSIYILQHFSFFIYCLYVLKKFCDLCDLHHCVDIFFWSSGIMDCTWMLFTFENGVLLMRYGASMVWHHSLLLMNSFNKTEAAVFFIKAMLPEGFLFISLSLL